MGVIHSRLAFVGVQIFTNFLFMGHNFGSRYARKPIKGFKDSHDSLVSVTTLSQKIAAQGRVKLAKKTQQHLHFWPSL